MCEDSKQMGGDKHNVSECEDKTMKTWLVNVLLYPLYTSHMQHLSL